jgi:hypothetical protein
MVMLVDGKQACKMRLPVARGLRPTDCIAPLDYGLDFQGVNNSVLIGKGEIVNSLPDAFAELFNVDRVNSVDLRFGKPFRQRRDFVCQVGALAVKLRTLAIQPLSIMCAVYVECQHPLAPYAQL